MRYFSIIVAILFLIATVFIIYVEGFSLSSAGYLVFWSVCLFAVWYGSKPMAKLTPIDSIRQNPDATWFFNDFEYTTEIIPADHFEAIKVLKDDTFGQIMVYDLSPLNIPSEVLDSFLTAEGLRRIPTVYSVANDKGYIARNFTAYDGLMVASDEGMVESIFWAHGADLSKVKEVLRRFPAQYPIIWVDWAYPCTVDCLNSSHITGVSSWIYDDRD